MPISRKKSCRPCRQAKARCDEKTPTCQRCRIRRLRCEYDTSSRYAPLSPSDSASGPRSNLDAPAPAESFDWPDDIFTSTQTKIIPDLNLGNYPTDWPMLQPHPQVLDTPESHFPASSSLLPDFLMQDTSMSEATNSKLGPLGPVDNLSTPSTQTDSCGSTIEIDVTNSKEMAVINSDHPRLALRRRPILDHCMLTNVIVGQLTGFPKMMIEGETLPPFIHTPCHTQEHLTMQCMDSETHQCLPKHLAICAGLVRMFYTRTKENSDFLWKSVYDEHRRIRSEYQRYDKMEQLEALQAVVVYMLLQAADVSTAEKNGVSSLIVTVMEITSYLWKTNSVDLPLSAFRSDRQGWIFQESYRRVGIILGITELLLEGMSGEILHGAVDCHYNGFTTLALPCQKPLWAARTNRAWKNAFTKQVEMARSPRTLLLSDVLDHDTQYSPDSNANDEQSRVLHDVVRWCENLDQLGTLLWMAVPFEKWRQRDNPW